MSGQGQGRRHRHTPAGTHGMALINALIVVAALAAVSLALLARTEEARQRIGLRFAADQAEQYLDAAGHLVLRLVDDTADEDFVHAGQAWAVPRAGEAIDRGTVGWRIDDLQGRFNINWLSRTDGMGAAARAALLRLAGAQDMPAQLAARIVDAADPQSLFRDSAFGRAAGASSAPPLPLVLPQVLRLVTGADEGRLDRLLPFLSALPPLSALNVNTVSPGVLAAFLPEMSERDLSAFERYRRDRPFASVDEFLEWIEAAMGDDVLDELEGLALTTGSDWFEARLVARLDTIVLRRSVVVQRPEMTGRSAITLSMPEVD